MRAIRKNITAGLVASCATGLALSAQAQSSVWSPDNAGPAEGAALVRVEIPFVGRLDDADRYKPSLSVGVSFSDGRDPMSWRDDNRRLSIGISVSGEGFLGLGKHKLSYTEIELMMNADSDEEVRETRNNTALYVVGGVVLIGGLAAIVVADIKDTINDCAVDLVNGPVGGCPGG